MLRPDIFNFSSFKNPDHIFQEMEKKFRFFLLPTIWKLYRIFKKKRENWVWNYILLCKERSPWEKCLKSQLSLYLHIYFSIVASITSFNLQILCTYKNTDRNDKLNGTLYTSFSFSTDHTQFFKKNLVRHKIKKVWPKSRVNINNSSY